LFDSPASRFCLAAFFIKRLAFASEGFMFQYASERFKWELRQTTWLRVSSAAGAVFATLAVGVLLNSTSRKRESQSRISDLNTIRLSLVVLIISFLGAWLAPSAPLLLIGKTTCLGCVFLTSRETLYAHKITFASHARVWPGRGLGACASRVRHHIDRVGKKLSPIHDGSSMRYSCGAHRWAIDGHTFSYWENRKSSFEGFLLSCLVGESFPTGHVTSFTYAYVR
jgi:hypothetical protein